MLARPDGAPEPLPMCDMGPGLKGAAHAEEERLLKVDAAVYGVERLRVQPHGQRLRTAALF